MTYIVTVQETHESMWEVEASSQEEAVSKALADETGDRIYLKSTYLNTNQDPDSVYVVRKESSK